MNVHNATRQVYFRGDPARIQDAQFYDAATDVLITTLDGAQISLEVGAYPMADLKHKDGTLERVELVPAPELPAATSGLHAGTQLFGLSIEADHNPVMNALVFHLRANRYEETGQGVARVQNSAKDLKGQVAIDHHQLVGTSRAIVDPRQIILDNLCRLGRDLGQKLVEELVLSHPGFANPKPPTNERGLLGGIRQPIPQPIGRARQSAPRGGVVNIALPNQDDPAGDVAGDPDFTGAPCDECGGTGEVVLFNGAVPCSKGCEKP